MSNKSVEQKPSETAVFVAPHRAIANKEFRNESNDKNTFLIHPKVI